MMNRIFFRYWPSDVFIFDISLIFNWFAGLVDCDYYKTNEYNYTHFVELSSLKDAQPTDYFVRVPLYVLGPRDGHIILSTTNTPNRTDDFVYEIRK